MSQAFEELSGARGFHGEPRPYNGQWRTLGAEDCACAETTHHFVVSHVHHPNVSLVWGAIACSSQNAVRVDPGHRRVHHLELSVGIASTQQSFQHASQTKIGLRISKRRGFPKYEDADGVLPLRLWHGQRVRLSGHVTTEKKPTETVIRHKGGNPVNP